MKPSAAIPFVLSICLHLLFAFPAEISGEEPSASANPEANDAAEPRANAPSLPGTEPLTLTGDIASKLVAGVDRFLLRELEKSIERRARFWQRDFSSPEAYQTSIQPNRQRLAHCLGVRDPRATFDDLEILSCEETSAKEYGLEIKPIRWPAFGDVHGEGLLATARSMDFAVAKRSGLLPESTGVTVIALPDADQTPEQLLGLTPGIPWASQFARRLAESGCQVIVPDVISRGIQRRHAPGRNGGAELTHREFLYRPAYELGRGLIGYEVQKILALVDWLSRKERPKTKIGLMGYGEGGMLALYAAALDPRIDAVCVSGYFDSRQRLWEQPIDRNVFGLLEQFGDAELASLVAPRALVIEAARGPELVLAGKGGAPAKLVSPEIQSVETEAARARSLVEGLEPAPSLVVVHPDDGAFGSPAALWEFLRVLAPDLTLRPPDRALKVQPRDFSAAQRQKRQVHELDRHTQWLLRESPYVRQAFMKDLDTTSAAAFTRSANKFRRYFSEEVIGRFEYDLLPPRPRARLAYEGDRWWGYEVVLDVFPDVIAYGILLLPKDLSEGERRPVVVCQHGLEGRPQQVIQGDHPAYHDFAARLADQGFITFAPQNLYLFGDRFRSLQRKAYLLKKTLFSIIVPQHQQIVNWLKTLPNVDPDRIAFYGLSYGGKTAMRVPSLVPDYCLSICSGDFNDWIWKNTSTRSPYSYVWTGEYEIFEFDLGNTFNYGEMAALIAPRPFMVERGHFDGVAPDETVAHEFAKVRFLYKARLGLKDRCEIEWFTGPHTIHGQGTFEFLRHHLRWRQQSSPSAP